MRSALLLCLLVVVSFSAFSHATNIAAQLIDGYEIIFLDEPGWVHDFHYNQVTNKFYAFGQSTFRQIDHGPFSGAFGAVDNATINVYDQPFIDARLFNEPGKSDLWAVGPSNINRVNVGYYLPVTIAGPHPRDLVVLQGTKRGYTFYAVSVEARNFTNVIVYLVGWAPGGTHGTNPDSINFAVVRARVDLTLPPVQRNLEWDDNNDVLFLHGNQFVTYHATFRPRIIHDYNLDILYVIDPNLDIIYSVSAPRDGVSPMIGGLRLEFGNYNYGKIAGSTWHYYSDILYVGFAGKGRSNSTLVQVDMKSMTVTNKHVFPAPYSNPRAIAGLNRTLYIGFEGGPTIVKFDVILWQVAGVSRLPEYLHQVYTAWDAGFDHVYFSTWEQHSKVFRIHKLDFCQNPCSFNAYCEQEICRCNQGFVTDAKGQCERPPTIVTEKVQDEGAAIALGILFALSFVAAAVGWVFYYRKNKEGYSRVM